MFALLLTGIACGDDGTGVIEVGGLRFVAQPANIGAGVAMTVTVELLSDAGARVATATNSVTLSASGGATLSGTTTVDAVAGLATFSGVVVNSIGQNIQLTASVGNITATSTTFAVVAGPASATQSTMTVPANVVSGANSTLTFTFKDGLNNPLSNVAVSFSTNLAGSTFTPASGTTDASGGFSTVFRPGAAGSASITVNVGGTSITFATNITVAAGAAALRFVTQPANVAAGAQFSVSVEVLDNAGQRLTTATNQIVLTLSAGTLNGPATSNASAGLATFNGLSINGAAVGTLMTATSAALTIQSNAFNITAGVAAIAQSTATFLPNLSNGVPSVATFTFRDAFSNPVQGAAVSVSSTIAGTVFAPVSGTTTATGVFVSTVTPGALGAGTITAVVGGTSVVFNVTAAGPCVLGALTIGTPLAGTVEATSGCSNGTHTAASFAFTMAGGPATVVAFTATGTGPSFFGEISVTPNPFVSPTIVWTGAAGAPAVGPVEYLLAGGPLIASVSSQNGGAGAFTLTTTASGTGGAGCPGGGRGRTLVNVTATYTGQSLAAGECVDASGPFFEDRFVIFDSRPCVIKMSATFDTYLLTRDFNTFAVGLEDDNSGGGSDSQFTLASCRAANGSPLIIAASSFDPSISGAFTLTVTITGAAPNPGVASPASMRTSLPTLQKAGSNGRRK